MLKRAVSLFNTDRNTPASSWSPRHILEGSYNERKAEAALPWPQKIKTLIPEVVSIFLRLVVVDLI